MLVKQFFCQRKRHYITIISIVMAITLIMIVDTVSSNMQQALQQQLSDMSLDVSYLTIYKRQDSEQWKSVFSKQCEIFISYYSQNQDGYQLVGIDNDLQLVFPLEYEGRMINSSDVSSNDNVCVLGSGCLSYFNQPKIGDVIYLNSIPFTVIGILKEREQVMADFNHSVFVCKDFIREDYLERYYYKGDEKISNYLFDSDDYLLIEQGSTKKAFEMVIQFIVKLLSFLSGFSLIIAFVGLINNALSNLRNRVKEIGLKRTLGASTKEIFVEFLLENLLIVSVSFMISFLVTFIFLKGLDRTIQFNYQRILSMSLIIHSFAILCGLFSAYKASKITIIIALRQ